MMGAKMEYDMRNDIFEHYQKLSFAFYDNQKGWTINDKNHK